MGGFFQNLERKVLRPIGQKLKPLGKIAEKIAKKSVEEAIESEVKKKTGIEVDVHVD